MLSHAFPVEITGLSLGVSLQPYSNSNCTKCCSVFDETPAYLHMSELLLLMLHPLSLTFILHLVKCCTDEKLSVNLSICS